MSLLDLSQSPVLRFMRRQWRPVLVIAGALCFCLVLWKVPQWQVASLRDTVGAKELAELEDGTRKTLAQILGGVVILLTAYFTWRRLEVAQENVRIAQEQVTTLAEGQITERFTRAIEQLGHEETEIRLGGIYALERIARDSEKDYWTIMEILTAYVRERAPRYTKGKIQTEEEGRDVEPLVDIQAILTVIGRRTQTYGKGEDQRLDLSFVKLSRMTLSDANLSGASLFGAVLLQVNLSRANLSDAILSGANLSRAILFGANLSGAKLQGADLSNAILADANLSGAILSASPLGLSGADLSEAIGVSEEQIDSAIIDEETKLPDYLQEEEETEAEE